MTRHLNSRNLVLVLLGGLLLSEIGLRLAMSWSSPWNIRLGGLKRLDADTQFRIKSNYDLGDGMVTNELGYLAPRNLSRENPPDRIRVIFMGDSASWVPIAANYPSQFEKLANDEHGMGLEVINAAVPGFAASNTLALLKTELQEFGADYFYLYIGWNDIGQFGPEGLPYKRQEMGYEIPLFAKFFTALYTPRLFAQASRFIQRRQRSYDSPLTAEEKKLYDAYYPSHYEENLTEIVRLAKQRYPRVFVMNLATLTNENPTEWELQKMHFPWGMGKNNRKLHRVVEQYCAVVEKVAAAEGVPLIDAHTAFASPEARKLFTDSAHMTPGGTRKLAELAFAALQKDQLVGRPEATTRTDLAPERAP